MGDLVVLLLSGDQVLLGVFIWGSTLLVGAVAAKVTSVRREADQSHSDCEYRRQAAIMQERSHLARELHDVIAHHLTVIVAGASAANRAATPEDAKTALGTIETVGRDALVEMRRLLGRLHAGQGTAVPPRLDQVPALVARIEQAGLPVCLTVRGDRQPLPDGVESNAYRIIQEALTNTLRHAGPTRAGVVVEYRPGRLRLRIHDEGHAAATRTGEGYGLDGMRQRATQLGGEIEVGPGPDGGFRIEVDLPVPAGAGPGT